MIRYMLEIDYNKSLGEHPISVYVLKSRELVKQFHGKSVSVLLVKAAKWIASEEEPQRKDHVAIGKLVANEEGGTVTKKLAAWGKHNHDKFLKETKPK